MVFGGLDMDWLVFGEGGCGIGRFVLLCLCLDIVAVLDIQRELGIVHRSGYRLPLGSTKKLIVRPVFGEIIKAFPKRGQFSFDLVKSINKLNLSTRH